MQLDDSIPLEKIKKILVVRMRHLGDVLLTTPLLSLLKKTIPHAQIDVFINKESHEILEGHPAIDKFFLYDRTLKRKGKIKRFVEEIKLFYKVRRENYDLVLNLTEGDRGAVLAFISKASYRVGFDPGKTGFLGKRHLYTHLVKICPHPRHTVERQLDVLRRIGIFPSFAERELLFFISKHSLDSVQEKLKKNHLCEGEYLLIHPVSRWLFKSPSPHFFGSLIQKLKKQGYSIVITGGEELQAKKHIQSIFELLSQEELPFDFSSQTSLKELGALIKYSKALITVDSLPLHLASCFKTKTIALFGPSSEINWGPWNNPNAKVIASKASCRPCYMDGCGGSKKSDCLEQISPLEVIKALDEMLVSSDSPH